MISNRLKQLIEMLDLSNAEFADEINVQPSSISHIISGRNRPSVDFIEKLHKAYPDLQMNWLLFGEGHPFTVTKNAAPTPPIQLQNFEEDNNSSLFIDSESIDANRSESHTPTQDADEKKISESQALEKRVEKIILFYNDGSFQEFNS